MSIVIIPAIDIIGGQCVRLTQGDYSTQKTYDQSPLDIAKELTDKGIQSLHMVDLDGAKAREPQNLRVLEQVASETDLVIDFGGGIKTEQALTDVYSAGAQKANIGSLAASDMPLVKSWVSSYGADRIHIGADVNDGKIAVHGWQESTDLKLMDFIGEYIEAGATDYVCTDIACDGMMQGSSIELYRQVLERYPDIHLIASGGVSSIDEIYQLQEMGVYGVILGKAIYEGLIQVDDLVKEFIQ